VGNGTDTGNGEMGSGRLEQEKDGEKLAYNNYIDKRGIGLGKVQGK